VLLLLVLTSGFLHVRADVVPDVDSFYHIRHAEIYRSNSFLDSSFPWAQYSVINREGADIWYGFHILLTPFTFFSNLLTGITLGGALVTIVSLFLIFLAFRRLGVRWPIFWVFVFLLAAPDVLYRFSMLRPHLLSLGLAVLVFAYLLSFSSTSEVKRPQTSEVFPLALAAAAFAWINLALIWLPVLIALVISAVRMVQRRMPEWKKVGALIGGLVLGVLARPNPIGALKIAWIQTGKVLTERLGELPIRFGRELTPFVSVNFFDQLLPLTVLLVIGIGFVGWFIKNKKYPSSHSLLAIWSSLILALGFLYVTFGVARRAAELFVIFSVLFLALLFTYYKNLSNPKGWIFKAAVFIVVLTLIYMPIKTVYRYTKFLGNAFPAHQFEDAANWLKENSNPQEIVFSPHWDRFAQLFFWNPQNYYINGMDPIFIFALDPSLYWKTHFFCHR